MLRSYQRGSHEKSGERDFGGPCEHFIRLGPHGMNSHLGPYT